MTDRMLLRAASAAVAAEIVELESTIRTPLPVSRRIGFASASGGTGCSATAGRVAAALHARRDGGVLAIDAQSPSPSIAHHAARPGLPVAGLGDGPWPDAIARWWTTTDGARGSRDLTVTDWGALTLARLQLVARHSHVLCLVAPAERAPLQRTLDLAAALRDAEGTAVVIAAVELRGRATAAARRIVSTLPVRTVLIPRDVRFGEADAVPDTALSGRTALAVRRLCGALVDAAAHPAGARTTEADQPPRTPQGDRETRRTTTRQRGARP